MAKAVRSSSSISVCLVALAIVVGGCARNAPALPPELGNDEAAIAKAMAAVPQAVKQMSCKQINLEIENLAKHDSYLEEKIQANRGKNQFAGYIAGVLFLPAIFAVDNDDGTKSMLDENQLRRDHLVIAYRAKECPAEN